jgi:hypothetical protein
MELLGPCSRAHRTGRRERRTGEAGPVEPWRAEARLLGPVEARVTLEELLPRIRSLSRAPEAPWSPLEGESRRTARPVSTSASGASDGRCPALSVHVPPCAPSTASRTSKCYTSARSSFATGETVRRRRGEWISRTAAGRGK